MLRVLRILLMLCVLRMPRILPYSSYILPYTSFTVLHYPYTSYAPYTPSLYSSHVLVYFPALFICFVCSSTSIYLVSFVLVCASLSEARTILGRARRIFERLLFGRCAKARICPQAAFVRSFARSCRLPAGKADRSEGGRRRRRRGRGGDGVRRQRVVVKLCWSLATGRVCLKEHERRPCCSCLLLVAAQEWPRSLHLSSLVTHTAELCRPDGRDVRKMHRSTKSHKVGGQREWLSACYCFATRSLAVSFHVGSRLSLSA